VESVIVENNSDEGVESTIGGGTLLQVLLS